MSRAHIDINSLPESLRRQVLAKLEIENARIIAPSGTGHTAIPKKDSEPSERTYRGSKSILRKHTQTEEEFHAKHLARFGSFESMYEIVSFVLPGGVRYTPDFTFWNNDGDMICIEVKGSYRLPSHGRALTAFRVARATFTHITFRWFARRSRGDFAEQYREVKQEQHHNVKNQPDKNDQQGVRGREVEAPGLLRHAPGA